MSDSTPPHIFQKRNPATGEVLAEYTAASEAQVAAAVQTARQAFPAWSETPLAVRARLLKAVASEIHRQSNTLAALVSQETGKPLKDALEADVLTAMNIFRYYAGAGPKVLKDKRRPVDRVSLLMGRLHHTRHLPVGVVAVISPWNYPLAIAASGIAASLMAGNTVILKPSEYTPGVGEALFNLIQTVFRQAGQPREVLGLLQGAGDTGAQLVEHPEVDAVIFTGSNRIGQQIQQKVSARNGRVSLELGSSDACVLLPGSNLEVAASHILWGRFTNAGQACAAIKRVYVHRSQEEALLKLLAEKISRLRVGAPTEPGVHFGPLINERQLQTVASQVEEAVRQGASLLAGGHRPDRTGYFWAPTLFGHVSADNILLKEEVFGPVLPVVAYEHVNEAIQLANSTPYGLTASVFGPDARSVAARLQAGTVVVNDAGPGNFAIPSVPWSGWKASGPGSSHGPEALLELTRQQILSVNLLALIPVFSKAPWVFSEQPDTGLAQVLLKICVGNRLALLNPQLLLELWRNRASRKI